MANKIEVKNAKSKEVNTEGQKETAGLDVERTFYEDTELVPPEEIARLLRQDEEFKKEELAKAIAMLQEAFDEYDREQYEGKERIDRQGEIPEEEFLK